MKTGRDSDHFSNISLTECQEAFRKALENKIGHALSGADIRTWSVLIDPPFRINFCENPALKWPLFLRQSILKWLAQTYRTLQIPPPPPLWGGVYGDSCFHLCIPKHNTSNASSVLTSSCNKKTMGGFLPLSSGCFHTLWPHNCVQTPYKWFLHNRSPLRSLSNSFWGGSGYSKIIKR